MVTKQFTKRIVGIVKHIASNSYYLERDLMITIPESSVKLLTLINYTVQ